MVNSIILTTLFGIDFTLILGMHTYNQRQKSITLQLGPTPGMKTKVSTIVPPTNYERAAEVQSSQPHFNNIPYFAWGQTI